MSEYSQKLRVLFVGAFRPPPGSDIKGGQLYACRSIVASPLSEHVEWIELDTTMESVPPPPIRRRAQLAAARVVEFIRLLTIRRVDRVLIFTSNGLGFGEKGLMVLIARAAGKPVVLCPRSGFIIDDYRRSPVMRRYIPYILRRCTRVVCQGRPWQEFFQAVSGLADERFSTIGNCIDSKNYTGLNTSGTARDVKVLLMGWVERNKGVFDLVSVADRYRRELQRVQFVVCGHGQDWDAMRALIRELGLEAIFDLRGWVEHEEKMRIIEECEVYLMLSHREGLPNALLEAMAGGRAVIATAVGAVRELVEDGVNGFLCQPGDIEEIGLHLIDLVQQPELRRRLGMAARTRVTEDYDISAVWRKWNAVLAAQ